VVVFLSWPDWPQGAPLIAAASVVSALAVLEASRLFSRRVPITVDLVLAASAAAATSAVATGHPMAIPLLVLPGLVRGAWCVLEGNPAGSVRSAAGVGWMALAAASSLGLLVRLRLGEGSFWLFMVPLLVCWLGDTAAYLAGCAFGRHRLAPAISPSKTWEGLAFGLAGSALGAVAAGTIGAGLPLVRMIVLGLAAGSAGALSDLVESALKRDSGAKDSGSFLPGHGGVLDRIDSLLAASPAAWLLLTAWGVM
jgi:phosphatidate cytidylyltransferase